MTTTYPPEEIARVRRMIFDRYNAKVEDPKLERLWMMDGHFIPTVKDCERYIERCTDRGFEPTDENLFKEAEFETKAWNTIRYYAADQSAESIERSRLALNRAMKLMDYDLGPDNRSKLLHDYMREHAAKV